MKSVTITVIEEISSTRFILRCARCEGTGRGYTSFGDRSTNACEVCYGKGLVLVEINGSTPFVQCARCEGTGRGYTFFGDRSTKSCESCGGVGAQPITGSFTIIR